MPSVTQEYRDGKSLELVSDSIDAVNVLKANLAKTTGHSPEAQQEATKEKTQFRQYEDACDRVKNFYKEQHAKQTVAFNLKARNDFKFKTRARMSIWEAMERFDIQFNITF